MSEARCQPSTQSCQLTLSEDVAATGVNAYHRRGPKTEPGGIPAFEAYISKMSHRRILCPRHKGGEKEEGAGHRDERREHSESSVWAAAWTGAEGTCRLRTQRETLVLMPLDTPTLVGV